MNLEAPRPCRARSSCPFKAREPPQAAGGSRPGRGVRIGLSRASPAAGRNQRLTDAAKGRWGWEGGCAAVVLIQYPAENGVRALWPGGPPGKAVGRAALRGFGKEALVRGRGCSPLSLPAPGHSPAPLAIAGLEFSRCTGSLGPALPWRPGGPCKLKRVRTVFTPEQLERLEKEFLKQQYLVGSERLDLAATLQLTETQVGSPPPLGAWRSNLGGLSVGGGFPEFSHIRRKQGALL